MVVEGIEVKDGETDVTVLVLGLVVVYMGQ